MSSTIQSEQFILDAALSVSQTAEERRKVLMQELGIVILLSYYMNLV